MSPEKPSQLLLAVMEDYTVEDHKLLGQGRCWVKVSEFPMFDYMLYGHA